MSHAVVIGGGIGGLAAGIALRRAGWRVRLLEQAPVLEPVGAGLSVSANGLKALDAIGVGEDVRRLARSLPLGGLRTRQGRLLIHTSESRMRARYDDSMAILLRAELVQLLLDRLDGIELGVTVRAVDPQAKLVITDTDVIGADLIVGADGIHSRTRETLFPRHPSPVYSGVTAWRAVIAHQDPRLESFESWGRGQAFGAHPMAGDLVYLYATDRAPAGATHADERAGLLRRFAGWHRPIPELLQATENAQIIRNDIYHLTSPLPAMHLGSVALVGDAAHPMTPNLGQGACTAIEDAVTLADLARDLPAYTAARLSRTAAITRMSAGICRMTMLRHPLLVMLREAGMTMAGRLSPDLVLRSMDEVLGWRPRGWAPNGRGPGARV